MPRSDLPHHGFVRRVAGALRRRCGVASGSRLVVACSGGADSVALARALAAIAPRRRWGLKLAIGHVQHHLRDSAEEDAALVSTLADRLSLPLLRADVDLQPLAGEEGRTAASGNLEARARRARYTALAGMADVFGAGYVATGHHGDDQLETVLMRLLRGASAKGLAGMAWRRKLCPGADARLVRPMLAVDHEQAVAFLRDIDQPWREDETNEDVSRWRARLRRDVLPTLRDLRSDVAGRAVKLGDHLRQVDRLIDREVSRATEAVTREPTLGDAFVGRAEARAMPTVVLFGLLRRLLIDAGVGPDALTKRTLGPIVRGVRDGAGGERRFEMQGGAEVLVTREEVRVRGKRG